MTADRLTVAQVAELYRVSKSRVRKLTEDGTIPHQRIDTREGEGGPIKVYVYSRTQIQAFLDERGRMDARRSA